MRTSLISAWGGNAQEIDQRVSFIARSPIERLVAFKKERGCLHLRLHSDEVGAYTRDYVHFEYADLPALNVFSCEQAWKEGSGSLSPEFGPLRAGILRS